MLMLHEVLECLLSTNSMTELFNENNTLTQLTTLQTYLRTLHNRGEINDDVYNSIRPH